VLRLQVHKDRHCIRQLGVVAGCGSDDGVVGGCGASGGYGSSYGDARVGPDGAEFLANVVCLGENDLRLDDRTPKGFFVLEG
jgi:hypothetical protein